MEMSGSSSSSGNDDSWDSSSPSNKAMAAMTSSDQIVAATMQKGFQDILIQTGTGLTLGFLAGVVLASRGSAGASSGGRKIMAGLGAGMGLGSAWTKTSMALEELLAPKK